MAADGRENRETKQTTNITAREREREREKDRKKKRKKRRTFFQAPDADGDDDVCVFLFFVFFRRAPAEEGAFLPIFFLFFSEDDDGLVSDRHLSFGSIDFALFLLFLFFFCLFFLLPPKNPPLFPPFFPFFLPRVFIYYLYEHRRKQTKPPIKEREHKRASLARLSSLLSARCACEEALL